MSKSWFLYDTVAEQYASAAEPTYFTKPAEDLLSLLNPPAHTRLLDIGAGSGAIAAAASRLTAPPAVTACDLSVPMLLIARKRVSRLRSVAGELLQLPFLPATHDAATVAFVLSHVADPVAALHEIRQVLTAKGKVAVSSWSSSAAVSPAGEVWQRTTEQYIEHAELERVVATVVPSESRLATPEGLHHTLATAGFAAVLVQQREYSIEMSIDAFTQSRLLAAPSRYLHARLSAAEWNGFINTVSRELFDHFGSVVRFRISTNLGVASSAG